jgi:hypothetical protein
MISLFEALWDFDRIMAEAKLLKTVIQGCFRHQHEIFDRWSPIMTKIFRL